MQKIKDKEFEGERPLYKSEGLWLENVTVHEGESALKECSDIDVEHCRFEGKYPLWCCRNTKVTGTLFTEGARAAVWYSRDFKMKDCVIDAPKMFREMDGLSIEDSSFTDAEETIWYCRDMELRNVSIQGGAYPFLNCRGIKAENLKINSKYAFQYCSGLEIHDMILDTKDAFWETRDAVVYDSVIKGEYLGWYSRNLKLVRCLICGTQPLCYADGLVLEDCSFGPDADLAFEYSDVQATIRGKVTSVKNPTSGHIHASEGYGEIILDGNAKAPANCLID